jgi:arsenite methyltransferase
MDAGSTVLDLACGSGTDLLLAARRVGPRGRAIGIDMTEGMRRRALAGARAAGLLNVEVREADATALPVASGSVDVVISNGVFNLLPDKPRAVREIRRVLKPGGRAQIADIVIGEPLPCGSACASGASAGGAEAPARCVASRWPFAAFPVSSSNGGT